MENKGNFVNRIGKLRGQRNIVIFVAVVAIGVAVAGWTRKLPETQHFLIPQFEINHTDCKDWCDSK